MRLIAAIVIRVVANALALLLAAWLLDDMSLGSSGFFLDVLIFTGIEVIVQPLIIKTSLRQAQALQGSSALISSFIALVIANWLSDDMRIEGGLTWVLATVIVWGGAILAALLLPFVIFKKTVRGSASR